MSHSFFVTGTDTDVGKTVVSSVLCYGMQASYWKPIQTGDTSDSNFVQPWAAEIFPEAYRLRESLSPHAAAEIENVTISMEHVLSLRPQVQPLVVEGAGGVLVPINSQQFMVDLMSHLAIPIVLVCRSSLGTINHTLLSIESLQKRSLQIAGVVMVGEKNPSNRKAIELYGGVSVIGEVYPPFHFSQNWMNQTFKRFQFSKDFL